MLCVGARVHIEFFLGAMRFFMTLCVLGNRWRATRKGNVLGQTLRDPKTILDLNLLQQMLLIPFSFFHHIWCQLTLIIISAVLVVNAYNSSKAFQAIGIARFKRYDVIVQTGLSNNAQQTVLSISGHVTLLSNGCMVSEGNLTEESNRIFSISFDQFMDIDGFSIAILSGNELLSSSQLLLQGSNDGGSTWTAVGQSANFRYVLSGVRFLESNLAEAATKSVVYDFRPPWPLFAETSMYSFLFAFGCFYAGTLGLMVRKTDSAEYAFHCIGILCSLNALIAGVGYLLLRLPRDSFCPLLHSVIFFLGTMTLLHVKIFFFEILIVLAMLFIISRYIQDCCIYDDCSYLAVAPPIWPVFFAALGALVLLLRNILLLYALRSISSDQAGYDARWWELCQKPTERAALQRLHAAALRLAAGCERGVKRQLNRRRMQTCARRESWVPSSAFWHGLGLSLNGTLLGPGQLDEQRPVDSLDQLYAQALCAARLLEHKASAWAAATRGRLGSRKLEPEPLARARARQCPPPVPLEELLPPTGCELVRRGCLKPPSRAVEKAASCYRGDVSRLLDVARARLLFESAADLAACLELVCDQDPAVRLVRVKDWLHAAHDSDSTAGFRVLSSSDSDVLLRK